MMKLCVNYMVKRCTAPLNFFLSGEQFLAIGPTHLGKGSDHPMNHDHVGHDDHDIGLDSAAPNDVNELSPNKLE